MSTPAESTPRKSSAASRYLVVLLLGLVLGVIATVMSLRALEARKDHFPGSVMTVQSWHMGKLRGNVETNRCNPTDTIPHLQTLRRMGDDVDFAFPDLAADERFSRHSANFRAVLDAAQANPPLSCESLGKTIGDIGGQCKACHDDFKKS